VFFAVLGGLLALLVFGDIVLTALHLKGGGPFSNGLIQLMWRALLRLHRRKPSHGFLSYGGLSLILGTILGWVILYWTGWTLIFSADPFAVTKATTGSPGDLLDRIYFVGFTMTTLGVGDFTPGQGVWQVLTVVLAGSSFFLLTMVITYLLPLNATFVEKRNVATALSSIGRTPSELLFRLQRFGADGMAQHLIPMSTEISGLSQKHLAYPALYFFHSSRPEYSYPVMLSVLDEFLTLVLFGASPEARKQFQVLEPLYENIGKYLDTLEDAFIRPASQTPAALNLDLLRESGVPTLPEEQYHQNMADLEKRRRLLFGLVRFAGWTWDDIGETSTTT
jgi:hypothetical protein